MGRKRLVKMERMKRRKIEQRNSGGVGESGERETAKRDEKKRKSEIRKKGEIEEATHREDITWPAGTMGISAIFFRFVS